MLNVLTKDGDKLILNGFEAIKNEAVVKYEDGLMIIDSRPYKPVDNQFRVGVSKDRIITDERAIEIANAFLENKNTLFIEAEKLYYIQDINFRLSDDFEAK